MLVSESRGLHNARTEGWKVFNTLPTLNSSQAQVFNSACHAFVNPAPLRDIIRCDSSFSMAWTRMASFRSNL